MKRHTLSAQDVIDIFSRPFVIPLASCARSNRVQGEPVRKALEHHLNLDGSSHPYYLVTSTTDGLDYVNYKGGDQIKAVDAYNKIDV